jgi:hypothetical protein
MTAVSKKSDRKTSKGTTSATSSPASVDGLTLFPWPDGPEPSGPVPVRASRSRRRAKGSGIETPGIFGLSFDDSSLSAALQWSLENRLQARMGATGSPEYGVTWKRWVIGSGLPICALRAWERPTSDSGSIGWPTATVRDARGVGSPARTARLKARGHMPSILCEVAEMAGWATPTPRDAKDGDCTDADVPTNCLLGRQAVRLPAGGWMTPKSAEHQTTTKRGSPTLYGQAIGTTATSSPAPTGRRGVLDPEFSRWLMGYPAAWGLSGATAMRSCRLSRRNSSGRTKRR